MSVLIKGMEMPKSCLYCPMLNGSDECCLLSDEQNYAYDDIDSVKDKYCPLVEIAKKHGRLIAAERLKENIESFGGILPEEINTFLMILEQEKTIIESEE